ncbi:MAG TPA: hypothetical protein GXX70_06390 [Tepidimicrobium sp.]|nr:hypothetical protein [Tepidimicrobium sp.]
MIGAFQSADRYYVLGLNRKGFGPYEGNRSKDRIPSTTGAVEIYGY